VKYPRVFGKLNRYFAIGSGILIFLISIFAAIEVVMRNIVRHPTIWTADVSYYLLIWAIFIGSGYAFQEHGHVRVDLFLNVLPRKVRKWVSALSYCIASFFITILGIYSYRFFADWYETGRKTYAMLPVLQWKLGISMVIGCAIMLITLIFIILDIIADGEKYL
jgi:TRAP-type C4-dicarboxylate transport system permease small subunit